VESRHNSGQIWPLKLLLADCMLGRCRRLDCKLDTAGQNITVSPERGRETNLEVEAHSRALHIRLVYGRTRDCSEGVVRIVIVDCE
jgi:hypothetical protein